MWERQIVMVRSVLYAMLLGIGHPQLTHELLVTLMAEATGIVNSRPIATIPSDTNEPQPLTPAMLLTMKTHPLKPSPGHFVPQTSTLVTCGEERSIWPTSFGSVGEESIWRTCRGELSGRIVSAISPLGK